MTHDNPTGLNQGEEALRRIASEIQQILGQVPAFIWKYSPASSQFLYASDIMSEMTGLNKADLLKNPLIWDERIDAGAESRRALALAAYAIEHSQPYQVVYLFHTVDSGARWLQDTARPAWEDGELFYYGSTTDITEQRLAEEDRARLGAALEQIDEAIVITDRQGVIEFVNPAFERLTGWPREEALGRTPSILNSGRQDPAFYKSLWGTLLAGEAWHGRFINKKKDGSLYEQISTINPLRDAHGTITHFVSVHMDMARQFELERQLRHAERLASVGETIAGLAHNIKNIIHTLKGSTYVIEEALTNQNFAKIEPMWEIYARNAERLFQLTQKMLSYVKVSKIDLAPVDANAIVRDTYDACATAAQKRGVALKLALEEGLPLVPCDETVIYDTLMNLVCNAVDACAEQGLGTVSVHTASNMQAGLVRIVVEDNGPGILPENLAHIFDPFFSTKGVKGTGLGLAMVKKAVSEHGGEVGVESAPGQTVFTINLPM